MVIAIIKEVDHTRAGINFIKAEVSGKTMKVQFDVPDPGSRLITTTQYLQQYHVLPG